MNSGKSQPSRKVPQDRDMQMNPLNPAHRNITGPNPAKVPASHGSGTHNSPGEGTGVHNAGRRR